MSFILDALRKSDAERQRAATPGISDVRYARIMTRRNWWLPVLTVVLLVNAIVVAAVWLRRPASDSLPVDAAAPAGGVIQPGFEPRLDAGAGVGVRPLARESEDRGPPGDMELPAYGAEAPLVAETIEGAEGGPAADLPAGPPTPNTTGPQAPPIKTADVPTRVVEPALPSAEQMTATGVLTGPPLNLDLHVYSDVPAERFVVINSKRYGEGATISEGAVVETITPDGVILSQRGTRFVLARR